MRKKLMAVLLMTLCLSVILAGTGLFSANADTFDGKTNLAGNLPERAAAARQYHYVEIQGFRGESGGDAENRIRRRFGRHQRESLKALGDRRRRRTFRRRDQRLRYLYVSVQYRRHVCKRQSEDLYGHFRAHQLH